VDATLIAEEPKISPHLSLMKERVGAALGLDPSRVGIKATTNESMGFLGRGEGIAALASACVKRLD
jgi:2-C-methyl-D-erythritol 2,4-cyclodiphosphate synthase